MNIFLFLADEIVITTGHDGNDLSDTEMIKIHKNGIISKKSCQLPDYPLKVLRKDAIFRYVAKN